MQIHTNSDKKIVDLRIDNYYLTEKEKEEWKKRNIIYNTLWFYCNKTTGKPDIEYSNSAIVSYKRIEHFKTWNDKQIKNKNVLVPPNSNDPIKADIMTSWWSPFKHFLKLEGDKKPLCQELLADLNSSIDYDLKKWLKEKVKGDEKPTDDNCYCLIEFLNVVYTIGNIIPAPINNKGNGKLDNWYDKTKNIFTNHEKGITIKTWEKYIRNYFGEPNQDDLTKYLDFIDKNHLSMYYKTEKNEIEALTVGVNKCLKDMTFDDWGKYFKTYTERIQARNKELAIC